MGKQILKELAEHAKNRRELYDAYTACIGKKLSAKGEIRSWARRPTMALPAHSSGARASMAAVEGLSEAFMERHCTACCCERGLRARTHDACSPVRDAANSEASLP